MLRGLAVAPPQRGEQEKPMKGTKAILAGTIDTPTERIENGVILIEGHRISKVGPRERVKIPAGAAVIDNQDRHIVPGFIDLHIHGAAGHDLMEGTTEAISAVSSYLARHGTTSYLATTVTASLERTLHAARGFAEIITAAHSAHEKIPGAQPLGIHFEGPFLNVKKRGAHPASQVRKPSVEILERLLEAATGTAKIFTLAPELDGALTVVEAARSRGLRIGIGHSNATHEEAERAIAAGATHAVHMFNAMRSFMHRDSGIIGAVLVDDRITAELICDGIHVEPPAIRLLVKAKGLDRIILVSDSLSGAGMPDGNYRLGNFTVHVAGGVSRTVEGNLAGSTLTLDAAVRNLSSFTGFSYRDCLPCATLNPAKMLGLEKQKGVITPGADADLAILDRNHHVTQTYVRGRPVL
jgi:N-acetylglucosamine-6-phosphate deacetylase